MYRYAELAFHAYVFALLYVCDQCHCYARPQLFTYLSALGLCHGALTCWNATWLVCVPPEDRKVMYVSAPILATAADPTVLRALSWQQLQALHFAVSDKYPARPAGGSAAADGGNGGSGGGGEVRQAGSGASYQDGATAAAGVDGSGHPPAAKIARSSSPTATPRAQHQQREVQLQFLSKLGRGRDGTVFSGVFHGQHVAIKVYSWEGVQAAAYARETRAYHALEQLQGSVVPNVGDWVQIASLAAVSQRLFAAYVVLGIPLDVQQRSCTAP